MVTIEESIPECPKIVAPDPGVKQKPQVSTMKAVDLDEEFIVYFDGVAHNIKAFLDLHPGGAEILEEYRGKDILHVMKDEGSHVHSETAYSYLKKMRIVEKNKRIHESKEACGMHQSEADNLMHQFKEDDRRSENALFDLEQPLLWQLWTNKSISKRDYLTQIHRPILSKKSHRLFTSDYLELLSKTPWWVIPLIWLPVIALLLHAAYSMGLAPFSIACILCAGLFSWTLIEYVFHRFLFHIDKFLPSHRYFYTLHFLIHGVHHFMPIDPYRLVMPPALFFLLTCLVLPFLNLLSQNLSIKMSFFAGILLGYVAYDLTHYYLHHANVLTSYMRSLKLYHMEHHFKDPDAGFGVTSKFWDLLFKS